MCWSSQKLRSGQVLGFFLDRSGSEKYRGSGPSKDTAQDREKVGPRTRAQNWELQAGQLVNPGVVWESAEMGPGRGERVREGKQGQGPRKCPTNCPGEGESRKVSIFRECLSS